MNNKVIKKRSFHPYFTTQSHNIVSKFIKKYTKPNDTVFDGFCGSGVTLVESRLLFRKSIGVDISKLACSISKISTTKFSDFVFLQKKFQLIKNNCFKKIDKIYKGQVVKYKPKYFKNIKLPNNADRKYTRELFSDRNFAALNILLNEINKIKDPIAKLFFRGLFSGIIHRASKTFFYDKIKWGGGNSSIFTKYRYWIPNKPDERNVWNLFEIRFSRLRSVISNINSKFSNSYEPKIYNKSCTSIKNIKNNSIDYIYIDPPYGANISYLDLSTMWYSWLFPKVNLNLQKELEIIEGGDLENTEKRYLELLDQSVCEFYRILKNNRKISLVFSHKNINLWISISKIFNDRGFRFKKIDYYPSYYHTFHKLKNSSSVLSGQLIVTFEKVKGKIILNKEIEIKDINLFLIKSITGFLKNKKLTIEEIIEKLVIKIIKFRIKFNSIKILNIIQVCKNNFNYDEKNFTWSISK